MQIGELQVYSRKTLKLLESLDGKTMLRALTWGSGYDALAQVIHKATKLRENTQIKAICDSMIIDPHVRGLLRQAGFSDIID